MLRRLWELRKEYTESESYRSAEQEFFLVMAPVSTIGLVLCLYWELWAGVAFTAVIAVMCWSGLYYYGYAWPRGKWPKKRKP